MRILRVSLFFISATIRLQINYCNNGEQWINWHITLPKEQPVPQAEHPEPKKLSHTLEVGSVYIWFVICYQTGTATSSPIESTPSQSKRALVKRKDEE